MEELEEYLENNPAETFVVSRIVDTKPYHIETLQACEAERLVKYLQEKHGQGEYHITIRAQGGKIRKKIPLFIAGLKSAPTHLGGTVQQDPVILELIRGQQRLTEQIQMLAAQKNTGGTMNETLALIEAVGKITGSFAQNQSGELKNFLAGIEFASKIKTPVEPAPEKEENPSLIQSGMAKIAEKLIDRLFDSPVGKKETTGESVNPKQKFQPLIEKVQDFYEENAPFSEIQKYMQTQQPELYQEIKELDIEMIPIVAKKIKGMFSLTEGEIQYLKDGIQYILEH